MADEERQVGIRITGTNETRPDFEQVRTDLEKTGASARKASAEYRSMAVAAQQNASSHGVLYADMKRVNTLVDQFGGTRALRSAEEYAGAVQKIGGASKLTAAEQATVHREVSTAIDKYRALGQQAPAHLVSLQKETAGATKGTGLLQSSVARLASAFAIGNLIDRAVSGLFSLGREAIASAGRIMDLHDKTKLSITAVQQYGYAAKMSGGDVTQWADAVFKSGINIETGGKKVESALKGLGLEYGHIRALKPEAQFDAIMRALASIESPQERNRLGVELMGKGYANVAAAVDQYIDLIQDAPVATEDAIRATDAAADAMERAWQRAGAAATNAIGSIALAWENGRLSQMLNLIAAGTGGSLSGQALGALAKTMPMAPGSRRVPGDIRLDAGPRRPTADEEADADREAERRRREREAEAKRLETEAQRLQDRLDVLTGQSLAKDAARLASEVDLAGSLSVHQFQQLGVELARMHAQGARFVGTLESIRLAHERLAFTQKFGIGTAQQFVATIQRPLGDTSRTSDFTLNSKVWSLNDQRATPPGQMFGFGKPKPSGLQTFGQELSTTMLQAVMGGGNVGEAAGSFIGQSFGTKIAKDAGGWLQSNLGKTLGGSISAALPGIGALLGPLAGKLTGWIVGMFTGGEGAKANDLRDSLKKEIVASIKGLENHPDVRNAMNRFNTAGSREDVQAAFDEATAAADRARETMERYGLSLDQLQSPHQRLSISIRTLWDDYRNLKGSGFGDAAIAKGMADGLNDLVRSALDAGGKIPVAFQPLIEQLIKSGGLADDVKNRLLGIETVRAPWQEMEAIAKEFNIDLGAMGPAFHQSKLIDGATTLAEKWKLLVENGTDVGAVIEGMKGPANDFLHNALRWGLEVPPSMRPMLEAMQKAGELTDENGDKLEDLGRVKWAQDPAEQFEPLTEALWALVDVFNVDLPNSIDTLRRNASQGITVPVSIDQSGNSNPDDPHHNQTDYSGNTYASGGLAEGRQLAWIAEQGKKEIVGDVDFMTRALTGAIHNVSPSYPGFVSGGATASPSAPSVTIYLGNHQLTDYIVETSQTAAAQGRLAVPSRSVRPRVSRG